MTETTSVEKVKILNSQEVEVTKTIYVFDDFKQTEKRQETKIIKSTDNYKNESDFVKVRCNAAFAV
jgi:hypothetical protein